MTINYELDVYHQLFVVVMMTVCFEHLTYLEWRFNLKWRRCYDAADDNDNDDERDPYQRKLHLLWL